MERIPCIKCDSKLWEYLKPYLERWGYKPYITFGNLEAYPLLAINITGNLGLYNNLSSSCADSYNRELVTDVEEFLERAAELKGFTYKRKDIMKINGIEIKPGMVITTEKREFWIVFPIKNSLAVVHYGFICWNQIDDFIAKYGEKITNIRDVSTGGDLINGNILWEKSEKIVISMDDIAKKFGYPVEQIQIKK